MRISLKTDISAALRKLNLSAADARKAVFRALNKTATTARANSAREIKAAGYGLKIGDIKDSLKIKRASSQQLVAAIRASGKSIPLIKYGARWSGHGSAGVSVQVKNGRTVIKGAFIATMPNGHRGVFVRVESAAHARALASKGLKVYRTRGTASHKHGLPLRELFGPSVPTAFKNEIVQSAVAQAIRDRFPIVFRRELEYIGKAAAR